MFSPHAKILSVAASALMFWPVKSSPVISPDSSLSQQLPNTSLSNHSIIQGDESRRFEFQLAYGDVHLEPFSMLMVGVESLALLAYEIYLDQQPEFHGSLEAYPDVVLDVKPIHPAVDVENRVAILCIYNAMESVARDVKYKNVTTYCLWDNEIVASVRIDRPGYSSSTNITGNSPDVGDHNVIGNLTSPMSVASDGQPISMPDTITAINKISTSSIEIIYHFRPSSENLNTNLVFVTMMATLKGLAPFSSMGPPQHLVFGAGSKWDAHIVFPDPAVMPSQRATYGYQCLVESVRQMSGWMMKRRRFAELEFGIVLGGIYAGRGRLDKGSASLGIDVS